jgi:hypothetical protein
MAWENVLELVDDYEYESVTPTSHRRASSMCGQKKNNVPRQPRKYGGDEPVLSGYHTFKDKLAHLHQRRRIFLTSSIYRRGSGRALIAPNPTSAATSTRVTSASTMLLSRSRNTEEGLRDCAPRYVSSRLCWTELIPQLQESGLFTRALLS